MEFTAINMVPGAVSAVFKCSGQEVGVVRGVVTLCLVNGQLIAIAIQLLCF